MSHDTNRRILTNKKGSVFMWKFMCLGVVNTPNLIMLVTGRHANHEKPKSARNQIKDESFYTYENVMRL